MGLDGERATTGVHARDGAASAEYVAAALVVAVVVAVVIGLALPDRTDDAGQVAVDCLFEEDADCTVPDDTSGAGTGSGSDDGSGTAAGGQPGSAGTGTAGGSTPAGPQPAGQQPAGQQPGGQQPGGPQGGSQGGQSTGPQQGPGGPAGPQTPAGGQQGPVPSPAPPPDGGPGGMAGSVTVDLVPDGPEDESPVTVETSIKLTQSRSEPTLGGDCVARVKLGASVDARVTISGEVDAGRRVTIGGSTFVGGSSSYDVTVDEATADAIENGSRDAPDPYDPSTLDVGSSVTLTDEFYTGTGMSVSYEALKATSGVREGDRMSLNVARVDDDVVRVTVGESEFIENNASFGLSAGDLTLAAGFKKSLANGEALQVDFDLSTPAGQDVYREFVLGGVRLPDGTDGVVESRDIRTIDYSSSGSLQAELGQVGISLPIGQSSNMAIVDETLPDGSIRRHLTYRLNESTMSVTLDYDDENDTEPELSDRSIMLQDVNENYVMGYDGGDEAYDGDQDVRIDFTADELDRLQQQAIEELWRYRSSLEPDLTRDQFDDDLDAAAAGGPEAASFGIGRLLLLATAENHALLLNELAHYPTPEGMLEELIGLAVREVDADGRIDGVGDMSVCTA